MTPVLIFVVSLVIMTKRNLRKRTKKVDYQKLNAGVDEELISGEVVPKINSEKPDAEESKQTSSDHNGGNFSECGSELEVLPGDNLSNCAERRLQELKKERNRLLEKRKAERIAQETREIEEELKKLKGKKEKHGGKEKITLKSLRGMDDVVDEVDRLMDKKFSLKSKLPSDSDEAVASSSSSASSSSDADSDEDYRKKKKSSSEEDSDCGKGKKTKSKRRTKNRRSGKNESRSSYVKHPQRWANTQLALHFACTREKKLEELSIPEFCAGFLTILETSSKNKLKDRMSHLKELMYLATKYQWRNVISYHAACLTEIERGHMAWGDNFQLLQSTTLAGGFLQQTSGAGWGGNGGFGSRSGSQQSSGASNKEQGTFFCRFYQRGTCHQSSDHWGFFNNERRFMKHICGNCWLKQNKVELHPETSDDCPLKQ